MLGSYDATEGPVLFMVDPSGLSWVGCSDSCGRIQFFLLLYRDTRVWQLTKQSAKTELEKLKVIVST